MIDLPLEFKIMIEELLGEEAPAFLQAMDENPVNSVRINRRKSGAVFPESIPVKWCKSGYYLPSRPDYTLDPFLHAGAYYVQDASSMVYESLMERLVLEFIKNQTRPLLNILDLCAAPGGKTTAMINSLPDGSYVTANEYSNKRVGILRENLIKWGYPEVRITNKDSSYFASFGEEYDIIAVDAPCSGEGMMRKDEFARKQWSCDLVKNCSLLQKEILENAVKALKPGGFLIYSTCTFNRNENEENAEFIVNNLDMIPYDPEFPEEWGIPRGIATSLPVYRFMPHKTKGEGLFIAVFRKPGEWTPSYKSRPNIKTAKSIKKELPEIDEILRVDFDGASLPSVELPYQEALSYLRRESIEPPPNTPKGHIIVKYKELNLGPAKNIGTRLNNLYPKNWRILKQ